MKKNLKVFLIVLALIILLIGIDIGSVLLREKPLFIFDRDKCGCDNKIYYGLLYDTFYCSTEDKVYIKIKGNKFSCPFKAETNETDGDGWYNGTSYSVDNVSMEIKKGTLTNKSVTLIIKDSTSDKYTFTEEFYIEEKIDNKWSRVKEIHTDYGFNEPAYYADLEELELKQNWEYMYGNLEKGSYRLVKKIFKDSDRPITEKDYKLISINFEI